MNYCYQINESCTCFKQKQSSPNSKTCFTQLNGGTTGGSFAGEAIDGAMNFIESNGLLATLSVSFAVGILLRKKR